MSSDTWTIEKELAKLSGQEDIRSSLYSLGILHSPSIHHTLETRREWYRAGAETYLYSFAVKTSDWTREYVIKACVAFETSGNLDKIIERWISKRNLIRSAGVNTPQLLSWGHGVVLEEYVPFELKEIIRSGAPDDAVLYGVAEYAGVLAALGFESVSPFHDLRSHGDDVVAIDFGQDLGEPNQTHLDGNKHLELLWKYLGETSPEKRLSVSSWYEETKSRLASAPRTN